MSCNVEFEVTSPIMVDANIRRWTICSDNIYLINLGMDWLGYIMTPREYYDIFYIYFSI